MLGLLWWLAIATQASLQLLYISQVYIKSFHVKVLKPKGQSFVDITITPVDDNLLESNETVTVTLVGGPNYDIDTSNPSATITIADNDFNGSKIDGTVRRDNLTGTNKNDIITGFQGGDILTGGAGSDWFVYTTFRDARDIITDFVAGTDQIVFTQLFQSLGIGSPSYSNAVAGGYLSFGTAGSNTTVLIDPDGLGGSSRPTNLLTVQGVDQTTLTNQYLCQFTRVQRP